MLNSHYDYKCDIWSTGVILFIMLAGKPPFNGEKPTDIQGKIKNGFKLRSRDFIGISEEAKAFIERLLAFDQNERPTAAEALKDPWIVGKSSKEDTFMRTRTAMGAG